MVCGDFKRPRKIGGHDIFAYLQDRRATASQELIDNFQVPEAITKTKLVALSYVDQLVLTATYILHGEDASPLGIAEKVMT